MPSLVRKLLIFAAIDGLVLQPLGQRPAPSAKILYKDNSITTTLKEGEDEGSADKSFEAFGIIGMSANSPSRSSHISTKMAGAMGFEQRMQPQNWDMRANSKT